MDKNKLLQLIGEHEKIEESKSYEHFHKPAIPWYEIRPFSELNDPLYGISSAERWKLVEPVLKKVQQQLDPPAESDGVEFDEWKRMYHDEWYKEVEKTPWGKEFKEKQMKAVYAYSGRIIAVKKGFKFSDGREIKRGQRGNEIDLMALEMFDEEKVKSFLSRMRETDSHLVHVQGDIMMLPIEWYRYVKN